MDRDQRRERVAQAYQLLVQGIGIDTADLLSTIQSQYESGITDEFMPGVKTSDFIPL